MPSSGARSGTTPSRAARGAGTGTVGPLPLACGHATHTPEPVVVFPGGRKLYQCPGGCGLVSTRRKRGGDTEQGYNHVREVL
ncbi:hypothetical protein Gocc_2883 [Gaiella occulta]|uniref:Uncharacterized protein n=1 Tax=Gaiella occulta TaxID=1002870 RepID=A0A7M2YSZ2_9ACTN|nr:hypothetical protein [Gaiella occulta]RDI73283.1 hypothetical protein Gocc_2883 [Gaiella occulta]